MGRRSRRNDAEEQKVEVKTTFCFSDALFQLKQGIIVTRKGWNGKNQYIALQKRTEKSKMTQDYLYIKTAQNQLVPWLASQGDLLADDWEVYITTCEEKGNCDNSTPEEDFADSFDYAIKNILKNIKNDLKDNGEDKKVMMFEIKIK